MKRTKETKEIRIVLNHGEAAYLTAEVVRAAVLQRFWSVGRAEDYTELPTGGLRVFGDEPVLSVSLDT